jgi:hypothetical protein
LLRGTPKDWNLVVVMGWSRGFWDFTDFIHYLSIRF